MKAAVLREFEQSLRIEDLEKPAPEADEVLLRVEACGVCHSDLHIIQKDWPATVANLQLPAILGHEVVGRVVEKGSAVDDLQIGERVGVGWLYWTCGTCDPCREGYDNLCLQRRITGIAAPGGYAEYMRAKASHVVKVPDGLTSHEAAPFFCAGVTMYHACKEAGIRPGQRVAVFGVGGLGHLALQFAKQRKAETIAVDLNDEKLEFARSVGADLMIHATDPDDVRQLTAEGGVHVAIVSAPSKEAYDLALRSLRLRGTLSVVGLPKEDLTFFADDLVTGEFRIVGSAVGTRADLTEALALAASGQVRCHVESVPLQDINDVLQRVRQGSISARAVVIF